MKLQLLLKREDLFNILNETLSLYISNKYSAPLSIRMNGKTNNKNAFLVNSRLNLIFPARCDTLILYHFCSEYVFNTNPLKQLLQYLYVILSCCPGTRLLLADASLELEINSLSPRDWLILPGNHSLRILDLEESKCIVLHKLGFDKRFFNAVIALKTNYPYLPMPQLIEVSPTNDWYSEEIISGTPLNRISSQSLRRSTLQSAFRALTSLYKDTLLHVDLDSFITSIHSNIRACTNTLPKVYDQSTIDLILLISEHLSINLSSLHSSNTAIPLARTHGDFQHSNILVPHNSKYQSTYLIDWEYSTQRVVWYDSLVFNLSSRSPTNLSNRLKAWVSSSELQLTTLSWLPCHPTDFSPSLILYTFILEDLLLRLQEVNIPNPKTSDHGLLCFLSEIHDYLL